MTADCHNFLQFSCIHPPHSGVSGCLVLAGGLQPDYMQMGPVSVTVAVDSPPPDQPAVTHVPAIHCKLKDINISDQQQQKQRRRRKRIKNF